MERILEEIAEALIKGKAPLVKELAQSCLDQGMNPQRILKYGLISGMNVVGQRFKNDEIFLPEVMVAARAMNAALDVLDPVLGTSRADTRGTVMLGTVRDDLHDVGKKLLSIMFRGSGFEVIDLGINVPEHEFVEAIQTHRPDILGISALLTLTLPNVRSTIQAIEAAGIRDNVIIMVGGAPVTPSFAREVGADAYAPDAVTAVEAAIEFIEMRAGRKA